uniref:Putative secreted protein n=1 Tax=Anopheles triannulatus TaxID=58253 RepID=A0A2M4B7U6_9DIPT
MPRRECGWAVAILTVRPGAQAPPSPSGSNRLVLIARRRLQEAVAVAVSSNTILVVNTAQEAAEPLLPPDRRYVL